MGLFTLFRQAPSTGPAALLSRYKQLRQVALELNNRLVATLSKDVLDEGGRTLGILRKGIFVFDTEDEMAVLMDYCLHDVRRGGKNAVERYLEASPPPTDSDEMVLLHAMRQARYALLLVQEREPGVGAQVLDILRNESLFLHDIGFGKCCHPGMLLASRIMCVDDLWMTTGAPLPFGEAPEGAVPEPAQLQADLKRLFPARELSPEQERHMAAVFIRESLRRGAAEYTQYRDPAASAAEQVEYRDAVAGAVDDALPFWATRGGSGKHRVGRGNMCRCGSGRKFKHCCGKKR